MKKRERLGWFYISHEYWAMFRDWAGSRFDVRDVKIANEYTMKVMAYSPLFDVVDGGDIPQYTVALESPYIHLRKRFKQDPFHIPEELHVVADKVIQ